MAPILPAGTDSFPSGAASLGRVVTVPGPAVFVGLCVLDVVHRVAAAPGPDEKAVASSQEFAPGGPATGAAVTYAALRGPAVAVTVLGRHPLARWVAAELAGRGVAVLDADPDRDAPPAVSAVRDPRLPRLRPA